MHASTIVPGSLLIAVILAAGCTPESKITIPTIPPTIAVQPTALFTIVPPTDTSTPTPTDTPTPTITPTPAPPDYQPMQNEIARYLANQTNHMPTLDIGFAFVDVQTGQTVSLDGDTPHYSLSTFKGPLGVYYLWLIEQGKLEPLPTDADHIVPMLNWSSNPDTSCVIKRVGGLAGYNDWLADQGFTRETNFVFRFAAWGCKENGSSYIPPDDLRYGRGDPALGLPGGYVLLKCVPGLSCDKVFVPLELAQFYARVYRGEVLNPEDSAQWLTWMQKTREGAAIYAFLPDQDDVTVYAKNGFRAADAFYDQHFYNEAGIVETPYGAFVVSIFMRGNPAYPGTEVLSDLARIAYDAFVSAYRR